MLINTLCPGKYAFNTYAGCFHPVPTTNFVLHWITGRTEESHRYDETLKSIDLVTADAYEPVLPLSVVVHIDYEKAHQRDPAFRGHREADHPDARPSIWPRASNRLSRNICSLPVGKRGPQAPAC